MTGPERTLRDEIARLTQGSITSGNGVDRLTEFVQARINAARADTAEAIAQAIERYECGSYCGEQCAAIARQHAASEGPRP